MRNFRRRGLAPFGIILTLVLRVAPAEAHAFGARYDLPLPLEFYLIGAGGAVALSFVIMTLVFGARPARANRLRIDLLRFAPLRVLIHPLVIGVLQAISVALFLLVLATGFFGVQETLENFAPSFVWIIWWVGFAYVAALIGNLWPTVNPWSIVYAGLERLARMIRPKAPLNLGFAYPSWLGVWPAFALFGIFAWFELNYEAAKVPATLATYVLIYSGLTLLGMAAFGRDVWLARGEAFSLAFEVFGRFAPIERPVRDGGDGRPSHWFVRPYAGGLVVEHPCRLSMTAFVLLMLSTVTFDGVKETPLRGVITEWMAYSPRFQPLLLGLHEHGLDFVAVLDTVTLALFPVLFLLVYLGFCWLAKRTSGSERPVAEIAGLFVLSLVPIAIAYHLAHYLSYLLLSGQLIIPLASDPFGIGWDLFGTAGYVTDITIVGAKFVWYTAVVTIVAGHVFAVGVAHFVALRVFESVETALRSQVPFLLLMIAYTMLSLWILSQPVVESPDPRFLTARSDTLTVAPFGFREYCVELAAQDEIGYRFRADRPVEFNIHYHDGATVRFPVQIGGVSDHMDRFVAEVSQSYCLMWTNRSSAGALLTYHVVGP